jgi:hypothetical protein
VMLRGASVAPFVGSVMTETHRPNRDQRKLMHQRIAPR